MFDVIILGSNISGALLGTILARHGTRVVMIDAGKHPRFSIGESTVRDTTKLLAVMAECFDVPELKHISGFVEVSGHVTKRCGLKRNFGFVYHRENRLQNPAEVYQVVIPDAFDGPETHYFRADIDHYMVQVAERYDAVVRENTGIAKIVIDDRCVQVTTTTGERFEGKYIVDATGYRSLLANLYDLREKPSRFKTHSRSIFTHMRGVKPYEECAPETAKRVPRRWSQGTLHHCFDGGWLWVIPFNNGPEGNDHNPLVSVGLQYDSRRFPFDKNVAPEDEWTTFLRQYPSLQDQFAEAEPVRHWTTTGSRLQFSSKRTIGHRFCLTSHAAGFLDPIYSRGLALTMSTLLPLADELLQAIADDDFSTERFEVIEQITQRSLDSIDAIVAGSYTSWRHYELWNAWVRIWYASVNLSTLHITTTYERYLETGARQTLRELMHHPHVGSFCPSLDLFQTFFAMAVEIIDSVEVGTLSAETATTRLFDLIAAADFIPPVFLLARPEMNFGGKFDREHWFEMMRWGNYDAPAAVKDHLFRGEPDANMKRFAQKYDNYFCGHEIATIRPFLDRTVTCAAR